MATNYELPYKNDTSNYSDSKILDRLNFDTKLNYSKYIQKTQSKANNTLKIIKAFAATTWGKFKETLYSEYKIIIRPVIEYATTNTVSNHISYKHKEDTNSTNTELRTITGYSRHEYSTSSFRKQEYYQSKTISKCTHHSFDSSLSLQNPLFVKNEIDRLTHCRLHLILWRHADWAQWTWEDLLLNILRIPVIILIITWKVLKTVM